MPSSRIAICVCIVGVLSACSNALHPAGTACAADSDCSAGLSCLGVGLVSGSGCTTTAMVCSKPCQTDIDCTAVGPSFKCFANCSGTNVCGNPADAAATDAAVAGDSSSPVDSGSAPAVTPPNAFADAAPFVASTENVPHLTDTHHVGEACSPCHEASCNAGIPCFLIGGTVYKDYKGSVPAPGIEVRVLDATGHAASAYSGPNGNFRIHADAGVGTPVLVGARDATTVRPMITTLPSGMCASGNCHIIGGSPDSGAYYPIHVP